MMPMISDTQAGWSFFEEKRASWEEAVLMFSDVYCVGD